jgi:Bacterial mobilisation protein (MobC).
MKSRLSSSPSAKQSPITVRVDEAARTRFRQLARSVNRKESELLRELITLAIESKTARQYSPVLISAEPKAKKMRRVTVRLPGFILDAAKTRARTRGMPTSRWIAFLVQSHLLQTPVMAGDELRALSDCNYELAAIGRNLNQIARILNADQSETNRLKLDLIKVLQTSVTETQQAIRKLVRASNNKWSTGDADAY